MKSRQDDILTAVATILSGDLKEGFEPIYEAAVRATNNVLPSQPSNEIRNFADHLANALIESDYDKAELELVRARRHLRFATYDATAIMVVYREAYVIAFVREIEAKRGKVPEFRERLASIEALRRAVPRIDSDRRFDPDVIDGTLTTAAMAADAATIASEQMNRVVILCNEFGQLLDTRYPELAPTRFITPQESIEKVYKGRIS